MPRTAFARMKAGQRGLRLGSYRGRKGLPMSSTRKSRANLTLPIDGNGKRFGHILLPWSRNDSAWGSIRIPIAIIANGSGPTVLLTGGNHGDEFEGPIIISEFVRPIVSSG